MNIKRFIEGSLEANCYIISETRNHSKADSDKTKKGENKYKEDSKADCYIIDPGYVPKKIVKFIREKNFNVKGILLTHHHYDHSGGVDIIRHELECPVLIHRLDADMLGKNVDVYLEDGDVIRLGEDKLKVVHTPGHTKGSVCFCSDKSKAYFTGDTIFNVDLGRTDLEDGSEWEMEDSITSKISKWGNDITIYPGHGDSATMKRVRKINKEFIDIVNRG